ncbi:hypothetical protein [Burkholderia lata]|uniref:hypothetical protein n=1 Tax=Burkholderia lata (strain ATCC 17760 / DSM 23089 / LMG 22485 / NCIMB 9086 / R18194 / 383) TaxID=482957 RepID=UPI001582723D|nr:hypothetical protein [Burkholderia lata]
MLHENGQAAAGVADRVLRDQQSVQRFAQRGKHRFLITNAGLLRWTQLRVAMSRGEAIHGTQGDDATAMSTLLQGCDVPHRRMNAEGGRQCMPKGAARVPESVSKRKSAPATHRAADHAAAHQQRCFPEFIALRNMVVMPWLARLSTCGDRWGCHDRPSIAMHFVMQTIALHRDHRNGTLLADP